MLENSFRNQDLGISALDLVIFNPSFPKRIPYSSANFGQDSGAEKTNEVKILLFFHGPREVLPMGCEQSFTVIGRWKERV